MATLRWYYSVKLSMGLTPTIRSGINAKARDLKLSLKASGTWALRTTMNSIRPSGSSMTLFMPTARRWYAKGSQTGCSSKTLETDKGYDEIAPIGTYRNCLQTSNPADSITRRYTAP